MVVMAYLHVGYGLKCYQCSDCLNTKCNRFYDGDECPDGTLSCSKTFKSGVEDGDKEMMRGCSTLAVPTGDDSCDSTTELCLCGDDECNSGRTITPTYTLALTLILAAVGRCMCVSACNDYWKGKELVARKHKDTHSVSQSGPTHTVPPFTHFPSLLHDLLRIRLPFLVNMKVAAACVVVLVAYLQAVVAQEDKTLKCYQCTDTVDNQEADKWCYADEKNLKDCPGTANKSCSKSAALKSGKSTPITRGCSPKEATEDCPDDETCYCDDDKCNSGRTITLSSTLTLTLVLATTGFGLLM
ncbi:hypothetical protein Pmani_019647 [Petrolisthes manimaculis]|uniref:Uncharacterized protein n=1 Tax=Petrolisthes manimaculis TaxID=1843537 RepID=A0AAE1PJZ6_9EUCA|nr:hypothetical protein Pmani_019647 [Petrolisthes manimaculis]